LAGVSPRATIALHRASRANAWLAGRDAVEPDDVRAVAPAVLRHRLLRSYRAEAEGLDADTLVAALLDQVAIG
jgi:MoxR-like ATPase